MKQIITNNNPNLYLARPCWGEAGGKKITDIVTRPIVAWLIESYPHDGKEKGFLSPIPVPTGGLQLFSEDLYAIYNIRTEEYEIQGVCWGKGKKNLIKYFDDVNEISAYII